MGKFSDPFCYLSVALTLRISATVLIDSYTLAKACAKEQLWVAVAVLAAAATEAPGMLVHWYAHRLRRFVSSFCAFCCAFAVTVACDFRTRYMSRTTVTASRSQCYM